jgi:hypothetical protein
MLTCLPKRKHSTLIIAEERKKGGGLGGGIHSVGQATQSFNKTYMLGLWPNWPHSPQLPTCLEG